MHGARTAMSDDLITEIKITASADGVEAGVRNAKQSIAGLSQAAEKAGEQGGKGLGKMGAGGEEAARKVEGATKNMVASLQRQIAALDAGGTATRQYQESLARMRGADMGALKPYLDQLDAAKVKAESAARAQGGLEQRFGTLGTAADLARGKLIALGGSLLFGGAFAFVKKVNDGVDALNDIKDATGATIENISALEDVALRTGASLDLVGSVLIKFNDVLSKATPKSDMALALESIGLKAEELRKLDPAEALRQTAVALSGYADDANKARLVQELFGKSVKDAAPFLADLAEKGALVGTVLTSQADEADRFNKQLFEMQTYATNAARAVAGPLVAGINEAVKAFRDGSAAGEGFWETAWKRYRQNVYRLHGMPEPKAPSGGGTTGSWEEPEAPKPSVTPPKSAAEIAAAASAAKKAAEDLRRELAEQAKLVAELHGLSGSFAEDWARLTKVYTDKSGVVNMEALAAAQAKLLEKQPAIKAAADAEKKMLEELAKASQLVADARNKEADGITAWFQQQQAAAEQSLSSVTDRVAALQTEEAAVTLATSLNISLAEAIERVAIERMREKQAGFIEGSEGWKAIERKIAARKELLGLVSSKAQREDEARGWADMWQSVDRTAHDVFVNVLEGGQDAFQRLGNTLKASVLDVLYQMTVRKWIINIGTSVFGAGFGAAATAATGGGAGGALSTIGSIGSGYSMLSGLGTFGGGLSAGFGGLMGSLGMSATGATLGGAMSAGSIAMGSGNIAGGLGTLAGALGTIAIGISLLSSLIKKSTPHMGAASSYSEAGGLVSNADIYQSVGFRDARTYNAEAASVTGNVAKAIGDTLNSTAKAFGKTAGYEITTAFADDSSKDGAWGSLIIKQMGDAVIDWRDTQTSKWAPKEFADGEAGSKEYLAEVAKSARDALVQAIGDVGWANDMLTALGESPTLEGLAGTVQQINAAQAAFESLGKNIVGFGALTDGAISQLVKAAGSIDGLVSAASTYYDNFYSEAEKTANVTRDITAALADVGLAMPKTRDEFRALVESQMAMGDAGTDAVAALLGVSGAFASVTAASETAADAAARLADEQAKAAARAAEEAARRAEEVARERYGLETQLMQLLGDTAGLRMREIEALDASNRALQEHIYAIEDARAAYDKSIASAQSAYGVLESSVGTDRSALQSALDAERDAISARYKLQQDGHAAQLSAAQSAADKMRGIASMLSGALGRMVVESPALDRARLQSARGVIGAAAASSNVMAPGLEAALSVVAGDVRKMYGKWEDFAFDQGVTAGQTAALSSAAQSQLTGYESIVNALKSQDDATKLLADAEMAAAQERFDIESKKLDERLEQGKSMLDRLLGIEEGTLSSVEALARLTDAVNAGNAALRAQKQAEAAAAAAALSESASQAVVSAPRRSYTDDELASMGFDPADIKAGFAASLSAGGGGSREGLAAYVDRILLQGGDLLASVVGWNPLDNTDASGKKYSDAKEFFDLFSNAQKVAASEAFTNGVENDISSTELSAILGIVASAGSQLYSTSGSLDFLDKLVRGVNGSHANGLAYVPFDGYRAELHQGERVLTRDEAQVYTPPAVVASMLRSGGAGDDEILAELRSMRQRLEAIEAASNATAGHTAGTDRKLARVIQNDAIKTETTV